MHFVTFAYKSQRKTQVNAIKWWPYNGKCKQNETNSIKKGTEKETSKLGKQNGRLKVQ